MTEVEIEFIDVGRQKFTGVVTFHLKGIKGYVPDADDIATLAFREARKHLISVSVSTVYNLEKNEGNIYAGFHCVGKFRVVNIKKE